MKDMCLTPVDFTKKLINYCISSFASFSVKVTNVVSGEFLVMVIQSSKSWAIPFGWNLIVSIKAPVSGSDQLLYLRHSGERSVTSYTFAKYLDLNLT